MRLLDVLDEPQMVKELAKSTRLCYARSLRRWAARGVVTVADVTCERVLASMRVRLEQVSTASVRQEYVAILAVLSYLESTNRYAFEQLRVMRRLQVKPAGARALTAPFLTPHEFESICQSAERPWVHGSGSRKGKPIAWCSPQEAVTTARLAVWSGLRQQELARLGWLDLCWRSNTLKVRNSEHGNVKTLCERSVPMCKPLTELLRRLHREAGSPEHGFILTPSASARGGKGRPLSSSVMLHRLIALRTVAGVPDLSYHLLRHTRASWWVQAGVPIAKVASWLGHSVAVCEKFYVGFRADYDADVERMPA